MDPLPRGQPSVSSFILNHSEGKKIMFVGAATASIQRGYANLRRFYRYPLSNFSMCFVKVPQTTASTVARNNVRWNSSIDVAESVLREIRTPPSSHVHVVRMGHL